jgi:hypothetical protein
MTPARFADSIEDTNALAARVNSLDDGLADEVLGLSRTRGTSVTSASLLRIAEASGGLREDVLGGLQRMLDGADTARLEAMRRVVAAYPPAEVAWAVRVPIAQAEAPLSGLSAEARTVIMDITAAAACDLISDLYLARANNALSPGTDGPVRVRTCGYLCLRYGFVRQALPVHLGGVCPPGIPEPWSPYTSSRVGLTYGSRPIRKPRRMPC